MATTTIPPHIQHNIQRSLITHLTKAQQALGCSFSMPEILYNVRGKVAGKAYLRQWQIRLNPTLLLENEQAFVQEVVPHELAHLVVYHQFGRVKPHGKEWQYVMGHIFNLTPTTRHNFDISSVQGQTFPYWCQCREHQLSIRRHNKVLRRQTQYHCTICGTPLTPQQ
nr:SprT family zinc-dependent metalloprotease [Vibrio aphrogenes]